MSIFPLPLGRMACVLVAAALPGLAQAQAGVAECAVSQSGSVQAARQLIEQGDVILGQISDCSQVNLMACEEALNYYRQAEAQIADVFFEAKGEACTWCDITPVGDVASELAVRGDHFTQVLGWDVDLRQIWNDYDRNWRGAAYCAGAQAAPAPTPPAVQGCAWVSQVAGLYLPDDQGPELQEIDPEQCRQICEDTPWCRSFTANTGARVCQFHDSTYRETPLLEAANPQIVHYTCLGR